MDYLLTLISIVIFIVGHVQLSPIFPHHSSQPQPSPPPTLDPTRFGFVHGTFIHVPDIPKEE